LTVLRDERDGLKAEISNLAAEIASGRHSPALLAELEKRERRLEEISDGLLATDGRGIDARLKEIEAFVLNGLADIQARLAGGVPRAKADLAKHCTEITLTPVQANTLQDSRLHPILNYMAHEYGGFNIFRRFRVTHLKTSGCPEVLQYFWSGQAQKHVSERYTKLTQKREFRLEWADRIGLGFELPGFKSGQLGQLVQFRKTG
jgi:hypothetical protein